MSKTKPEKSPEKTETPAASAPPPAKEPSAEETATIREEAGTPTTSALPMLVSAKKKKELRGVLVYSPEDLYVDSPVEDGGYGSFAADGREDLPVDAALLKSLIRHYTTDNKGRVYQSIATVKVTIGGDDTKPLLVVLNGRQRRKGIMWLRGFLADLYVEWKRVEFDRVKLKNKIVAAAASAANSGEKPAELRPYDKDGLGMSWIDEEDAELLVGGRVNGDGTSGLLSVTKDSTDGPMPYLVKVEFMDVDPNDPEALEISLAERINVKTPPSVEANQIRRLLAAGRSVDSVAANMGVDKKTIHNKMLILHVIPEVQAAIDDGVVSWTVLKQCFFRDTKRNGVVPFTVEEQKSVLAELLAANAGKGKDGKKIREALVPSTPPAATPPAAPPSTTPPAPTTPSTPIVGSTPPPSAAPSASPSEPRRTPGFAILLPRAAAIVSRRVAAIPTPSTDDGADAYFEAKLAAERARTIAAVFAYLGGAGNALDALGEETKALAVSALSEAEDDVPAAAPTREKKVESISEKLARRVLALFPDEGEDVWPENLEEDTKPVIGRLQAAFAEKHEKGETKADFARRWVLVEILGVKPSA